MAKIEVLYGSHSPILAPEMGAGKDPHIYVHARTEIRKSLVLVLVAESHRKARGVDVRSYTPRPRPWGQREAVEALLSLPEGVKSGVGMETPSKS